jgi:hypothetical protein
MIWVKVTSNYFHRLDELSKNQFIFHDIVALFYKISSLSFSQRKLNGISSLDQVGIKVPLPFIRELDLPWLNRLLTCPLLGALMNKDHFRFLFTDPNQKDPDTTTGILDRYFPHIDKNGEHRVPAGSLNFGAINCSSQSTTFWHEINSSELISEFDWVDILYRDSPHTIVAQYNLQNKEACLFRTELFHSVINQSGSKRVVAGWHSQVGISWLDLVSQLNSYELSSLRQN